MEAFVSLSMPADMDDTIKERLELLELSLKRPVPKAKLLLHARKFPALFFNTYSEKDAISFLRKRLNDVEKGELEREKRKFGGALAKYRRGHQTLYSLLGKEAKQCAHILQESSLLRYRLKHVWSGAEFLCLNLIREIAGRMKIPFNDLIKTVMLSDIADFFEKGVILNGGAIRARRKFICLHYHNGTVNRYFGARGLGHFRNMKIAKDKYSGNEPIIRGSTANQGIARGRVKIVLVGDLRKFERDCKEFEKGGILITTMTSPLMVPIIAKAAAIVTDEGGICSHAAVISREFGIPCIVGTHDATASFKDGDFVEVDAHKGIVRKLK